MFCGSGFPRLTGRVVLKMLTELAGEPRLDVALLIALRDAVEHRLEKVNKAIRGYEHRYKMRFEQFQARGQTESIPDQFSYKVEKDYLEWDGLTSRKKKLEDSKDRGGAQCKKARVSVCPPSRHSVPTV